MLLCGMFDALFGFSNGTELAIALSQAMALIIFGLIGLLLVRPDKAAPPYRTDEGKEFVADAMVEDPSSRAVKHNRDKKFDLQLSQALINERKLADIFINARLEKIELKSESFLWERTGNIVIEYMANGKPSGIQTTEADMWVHELKRNDSTHLYLMIPDHRLRTLCKEAYTQGRYREGIGDGGRFCVILLKLADLLK